MKKSKLVLYAAALVVVAGGGLYLSGLFDQSGASMANAGGKPMVDVTVPKLGQIATLGAGDFDANCAACHGKNAAGSDSGPPLVHRIYEPGHHADISFKLAANRGVRAHHWRFGNMPPQPQVSEQAINRIIAYVRELQRANGIY